MLKTKQGKTKKSAPDLGPGEINELYISGD